MLHRKSTVRDADVVGVKETVETKWLCRALACTQHFQASYYTLRNRKYPHSAAIYFDAPRA